MDGAKIVFTVFGLNVTEVVIFGWAIIAVVTVLCLWLTNDIKKSPSKKQVAAEMIVNTVNKLIKTNMGDGFNHYAPLIGALFVYCIFGSLIGMLGLKPITTDLTTTITWSLIVIVLVLANRIKYRGFGGFIKGYGQPMKFLIPSNIINDITLPVSMAFRLFGNMVGGMVITSLLYRGLTFLSNAIGLGIPLLTFGIPAVLSAYFDLFSGFIQAFIFITLTMANIGLAKNTD